MRRALFVCTLILVATVRTTAQGTVIRVEVRSGDKPVENAAVVVGAATAVTDANGRASLPVSPGSLRVEIIKEGFVTATVSVQVQAGQEQVVQIELQANLQEEVTVIGTTRTEKRLEDQPMRVEVLLREEIEEKILMTPGDIVMMLNEMGGMRVQATSPSLGAASVRIQGMRGRYTRFLSDGLPLFGEVGGLGLLQIPPTDLGQVEVIKGVASALYGAGAMGGVVNLISRHPTDQPVRELLLNRSTRGATDTVFFGTTPLLGRWRGSLLTGGHWQEQTDVDGDDWSDLPHYARGVVRPRVFWDDGKGRSLFATVGATYEDRVGGSMANAVLPRIGVSYQEALQTTRFDAGAVGQVLFRKRYVLTARAAINRERHQHRFGEVVERDRHQTNFGEVAIRGTAARQTWVIGAALEQNRYVPRDVSQFAYSFTIPGVFLQDDVVISSWLSLSASGRIDHHSEYGTFFSPRLSGLMRAGDSTIRLSAGTGFFGPSVLTEETEAAGLSRLSVPRPLTAERGRSASVDISRAFGPASVTFTAFASRIRRPIHVDRAMSYVLTNSTQPTTNTGVEVLATLRHAPFSLTGTYTFVNAREAEDGEEVDAALTPKHSAGLVGMMEAEAKGRLGVEVYYTGRQRLEYNPYRNVSRPYVIIGFLGERRFGRLRLFLNAENVTNVRQSHWDPLLLRQRAADGRWTVDAWAPLEGRVFNGGIRLGF